MNDATRTARLPVPDAQAVAHSRRVEAHVLAAIEEAGGWLAFDRYMETVLYAPGLGYYAAGARKFGAGGDFVTAPELTPLFGRALAGAVARAAASLGESAWALLEFGGGTGALADALLGALADARCLPARHLMLEVSPDLRARQRERLADTPGGGRVHWLDVLPPAPLTGVILANEVLDALPVTRFRIASAGGEGERVQALGVVRAPAPPSNPRPGQRLALAWRPADAALHEEVAALETRLGAPLPPGYQSELAPRRSAWLASVATRLTRGALLLVDYGVGEREYFRHDRRDGTLLCHYRHRAHDDVLFHPGLQDITAWVDFTAIATQARHAGLTVAGFTHQAGFLLGNGFATLANAALAQAADARARYAIAAACRRLLLPGEMGERFRVLALTRGDDVVVPGLGAPDLRHTL